MRSIISASNDLSSFTAHWNNRCASRVEAPISNSLLTILHCSRRSAASGPCWSTVDEEMKLENMGVSIPSMLRTARLRWDDRVRCSKSLYTMSRREPFVAREPSTNSQTILKTPGRWMAPREGANSKKWMSRSWRSWKDACNVTNRSITAKSWTERERRQPRVLSKVTGCLISASHASDKAA